jgi:hypothetical protein
MGQEETAISLLAFQNGVRLWNTHANWPRDFHSQLYRDLGALLAGGVTPSAWEQLVDILWDWRAIRPKTKQYIRERGAAALGEINRGVDAIRRHRAQFEISDVTWDEVEPLFQTAMNIKDVTRPVFASKLCHFLAPSVFPVIDNEYIGLSGDYAEYWKSCRQLWAAADGRLKTELKAELGKYVRPENAGSYPWATKIVEICLSGMSKT